MGTRSPRFSGNWNVAPGLPPSRSAALTGPTARSDGAVVRAAVAAIEPLERRTLLSISALLDYAPKDVSGLLDYIFALAKKNKVKPAGIAGFAYI